MNWKRFAELINMPYLYTGEQEELEKMVKLAEAQFDKYIELIEHPDVTHITKEGVLKCYFEERIKKVGVKKHI